MLTFMRVAVSIFLIIYSYGNIAYASKDNLFVEKRAKNIFKQLRCMVCEGQAIDESGSWFANDLKLTIRQQLSDGMTDKQILNFLVQSYGDIILLKPPIKPSTYFLWFAPFLFLVIGLVMIIIRTIRNKPA